MLLGADNAFTGEVGKGKNQLTQEKGIELPKVARNYQKQGKGWIVIGDENYGEGSSREHAAMSPRFLGCSAVIARSFARIHETNLKKQGVLALHFDNPADYDKVKEDDRIDLVDLKKLAPNQKVKMKIKHADGTAEEIWLKHTYIAEQLKWFVAGSALNLLRQ
jgi:aconitate hydratase